MPNWLTRTLWILLILSWIPLAWIAGERKRVADQPRISIITHMDQQMSFRAQEACDFFADGRAMRPRVTGTISRDEDPGLDSLFTGKIDGRPMTRFPVRVDMTLLERGRDRYGIFCAPCHGLAGYGDGMIAQRALALKQGRWTPPANLHSELVRGRPVGQLFNTISEGVRNMPAYGSQIPARDRWAIVAYIKALQRSQHAAPEDVPADRRAELK